MAIKKIFWTYRPSFYNKGEGEYLPSYRLDQQYADYKAAGITNTLDNYIPENRYISEIVPWIKKKTRFIIGEYEDTVVNVNDYIANVQNVWSEFQIEMFATPADAIAWIKANTDLLLLNETLDTNWVSISAEWEINPASTDVDWITIPAKTLIIN